MVLNNLKRLIYNIFPQRYNYPTIITTLNNAMTNSAYATSNFPTMWTTGITDIDINSSNLSSGSGLSICVGTGTTAPTADDYTLETPISTSSISCLSTAVSFSNNKKTITSTLSNNTASDIDIKEVGLMGKVTGYDYSSYIGGRFLLERTVLDSAITIPAGESRAITYELSM